MKTIRSIDIYLKKRNETDILNHEKNTLDLMMNKSLSRRISKSRCNFHLSTATLTGTRTGSIIHTEEIPHGCDGQLASGQSITAALYTAHQYLQQFERASPNRSRYPTLLA